MITLSTPAEASSTEGQPGTSRYHIDPREGLQVAFHNAVETLKGQFLQAVALGVLVATLAVIGVDKRRRKEETGPQLGLA